MADVWLGGRSPPTDVLARVTTALLAAQGAAPRQICEVRPISDSVLHSHLRVHVNSTWSPGLDSFPTLLRVGRARQRAAVPPLPSSSSSLSSQPSSSALHVDTVAEYLFAGSIDSRDIRWSHRPSCDVLFIGMEASTPSARVALQEDIGRILTLSREPEDSEAAGAAAASGGAPSVRPLVIFHGNATCALPLKYAAMGYMRFSELCWKSVWRRLVRNSDVVTPSCSEGRAAHARQAKERWCVGALNVTSSCTNGPPLLEFGQTRGVAQLRLTDGRTCRARARKKRSSSRRALRARRHSSCRARRRLRRRRRWRRPAAAGAREALCLLFKNNAVETYVGGVRSTNGGLLFRGGAELVIPTYYSLAERSRFKAFAEVAKSWGLPAAATLTHNYAALRLRNGSYILVGGRHRRPETLYNGIWIAHGESWRWNDNIPTSLIPVYRGRGVFYPLNISARMQWSGLRRMMTGAHAGCVEARDLALFPQLAGAGICEFDGRLSLAQTPNGSYILYARANRASKGGHRSVQASTSVDLVHGHRLCLSQSAGTTR